jgi:hypothetical protein
MPAFAGTIGRMSGMSFGLPALLQSLANPFVAAP